MMTRAMAVAALAMGMAACSNGHSWNSSARNDTPEDTRNNLRTEMHDSAQTGMTNGTTNANRMQTTDVSDMDRRFVETASAGGAYEVQASQLALQKTQDAHVRMIAQHMIHDHTQANQQLSQAAQQKGLTARTAPSEEQKRMINELQGLNGADFVQKYVSQQTQAHKETIALFQSEASSGQDAALRGWASQTLPTLENHLRMIQGDTNNMSSEQH